jgi:hypothetical protein
LAKRLATPLRVTTGAVAVDGGAKLALELTVNGRTRRAGKGGVFGPRPSVSCWWERSNTGNHMMHEPIFRTIFRVESLRLDTAAGSEGTGGGAV